MSTLRITRFSYDAFNPQCQVNYLKENLINKDANYNHEFDRGIWVFVKNMEDRWLLNHLSDDEIEELPCWEGEIPLSAKVYKHDTAYKKDSLSTVEIEKNEGVFFIPEPSISLITNIKESYNFFSND